MPKFKMHRPTLYPLQIQIHLGISEGPSGQAQWRAISMGFLGAHGTGRSTNKIAPPMKALEKMGGPELWEHKRG